MHLSWAKIVDVRVHPKYGFVGGYLAGSMGDSPLKCRHFASLDEALAHARTICPVVWRNLENCHHKKKFRQPNGLVWQIYDPRTGEWIDLLFVESPYNIMANALCGTPHANTYILRAAPIALEDLASALRDNYVRIVALIAEHDGRVTLKQ